MEYLGGDRERPLILGTDNEGMLMWYVNALFAVHPNMRGHTGGRMTMGRGFPMSVSTKQMLEHSKTGTYVKYPYRGLHGSSMLVTLVTVDFPFSHRIWCQIVMSGWNFWLHGSNTLVTLVP